MTKKRSIAILLIVVLLLLVTAGTKEKPGIVSTAGVYEESSSNTDEEIRPADAAKDTETPPVIVPVSEMLENGYKQDVNDAIEGPDKPKSETETDSYQSPSPAPILPETPDHDDPTPTVHVHSWVDEVIAYHEAVTHIEHHDAVTEQRWISMPVEIQHFYCDVCHKEFSSQAEAYAHEDATYQAALEANDMSLIHAGHYSIEETVDQGYYETVVVREAYDETIIDQPAWEEHIFRCSTCGATA